jgi:hypothetical protein
VWIVIDPGPYTPGVLRQSVSCRHDRLPFGDAPGLEISPVCFFQDLNIKCLLSYQLLETTVLLLEFLQSLDLDDIQSAVFFPPAVVGVLGNIELTTVTEIVLLYLAGMKYNLKEPP